MGSVHTAIAAVLAAEVERRREWDETPALYRLHLSAGRPRLAEIPVDPWVWDSGRPAEMLEHIGAIWAMNGWRSPWPDLFGLAFRHEGWSVDLEEAAADAGSTAAFRAQARAVHADALRGRLHARPDRYEVRMIYAVDRASVSYEAVLRRGTDRAARQIFYPGGDPASEGGVPSALDLMVSTLTGIPAQPRVEPPDWLTS